MIFKPNTKSTISIEKNKVAIKFDITMLNSIIGSIFKKSVQVTRKSLMNMKRLFEVIDENVYEGNEPLEARIQFINRALEAKLDMGFENDDAIINYCRTDTFNKENNEIINNIPHYTKLNYEELRYINKAVEDRLKYYYLYNYKDAIYDTIERLDSGEYSSFSEINSQLVGICSELINEVRKAKSVENTDTFSLSDETIETSVTDIVNRLKNPSRNLRTGIRKLNEILSPAFMGGRLYTFMGLPGGFKSGMLLKIARDIKIYNKGIQVKKPGKKPCVLLVTMENSVDETVERLFNMVASTDDIRKFTPKQVVKLLKTTGEMAITDDNDIDIIIKYHANRTIDTSDLYTIIEDLCDDGLEVIALILDYIKRIRPAEKAKDEKEELKNITNELKTLALELDIPVITAHQLNRSGATAVDAAMQANKEDLARLLGRSNVGSAWEIVENCDWICIIFPEKKRSTDQYYLTFKRIKIRYKEMSDLGYFNHPFYGNNKMRLMDDVNLEKSLSEDSLVSDFEGVDVMNKNGRRTATDREIVDDNDTLFDFSKQISSKKNKKEQ